MSDQAPAIVKISTKPIKGQKMGTSGLRKTVKEVQQPHYIENVYQSILNALLVPSTGTGEVDWKNHKTKMMAIGGDGRYYNKDAIQIFIRMAYANHEKFLRPGTDDEFLLLVAHNGIMSTPSMSCVIRGRGCNLGGVILTASHNPGGPNADFGIKYNESNGGPAREIVTSRIGVLCDNIDHYFDAPTMTPVDLSRVGQPQKLSPTFSVQVIDSTDDYVDMLKTKVFDFGELRTFLQQSGFKFLMDSMNGVTGPYARRIFCQELGLDEGKCVMRAQPLEDFGGLHPDPNLTYAADLVNQMFNSDYDMGAASDGDGDRNMILGNRFFVTPSDSVAIMAEHATKAIPYFRKMGSLPGVARSMPTSTALDRVAKSLDIPCYETPTGWKFFGNLMDSGKCVLCGEESFGTGSDHVREKDGLFAVLCWLSICAYFWRQNGNKIVSIRDIVAQHWTKFGRSFYTRYDYEQVESAPADKMIETMRARIGGISTPGNGEKEAFAKGQRFGVSTAARAAEFELSLADEFEYLDPVDGSRSMNQGLRFFFTDGSRIVFRLSGTGSTGATIRVYIETYIPFSEDKRDVIMNADSKDVTKQLHAVAMQLSRLPEITGRTEPTVIT